MVYATLYWMTDTKTDWKLLSQLESQVNVSVPFPLPRTLQYASMQSSIKHDKLKDVRVIPNCPCECGHKQSNVRFSTLASVRAFQHKNQGGCVPLLCHSKLFFIRSYALLWESWISGYHRWQCKTRNYWSCSGEQTYLTIILCLAQCIQMCQMLPYDLWY